MCIYIYIHVYLYTFIYLHIHIYIYRYRYTYICIYIYINIHQALPPPSPTPCQSLTPAGTPVARLLGGCLGIFQSQMCHAMADLDGHLHRAVAAVQNTSEKTWWNWRGNNQDQAAKCSSQDSLLKWPCEQRTENANRVLHNLSECDNKNSNAHSHTTFNLPRLFRCRKISLETESLASSRKWSAGFRRDTTNVSRALPHEVNVLSVTSREENDMDLMWNWTSKKKQIETVLMWTLQCLDLISSEGEAMSAAHCRKLKIFPESSQEAYSFPNN